ncbi:hypothetical protein ONZ43_g2271 [Nemania bipapillata]|uniref:Uncharacterized protein n=1 Tax=Nemania bipapillata TaxID=110536 RepID=A0ACC2J1A0_9PEZI|nr:hypothetical protein ONZ43_g2271 [Nemania bipapillata]
MDALKKVIGGDKQNTQNANPAGASGQKDDYGDKGNPPTGAEFINKKYLNDKLSRDQLEKVTDSAREGFEKMTGKNVPDKFSN